MTGETGDAKRNATRSLRQTCALADYGLTAANDLVQRAKSNAGAYVTHASPFQHKDIYQRYIGPRFTTICLKCVITGLTERSYSDDWPQIREWALEMASMYGFFPMTDDAISSFIKPLTFAQ